MATSRDDDGADEIICRQQWCFLLFSRNTTTPGIATMATSNTSIDDGSASMTAGDYSSSSSGDEEDDNQHHTAGPDAPRRRKAYHGEQNHPVALRLIRRRNLTHTNNKTRHLLYRVLQGGLGGIHYKHTIGGKGGDA